MKCLYLAVGIAVVPATVWSQEAVDTVAHNLKEVVVNEETASMAPGMSRYVPTKRQKEAAANMNELLRMMALPQINVRPGSDEIRTETGQSVQVYIDMQPAVMGQLAGIPPAQVRSVEYLTFPVDPRYNGAKYVLDVKLVHYSYGGYTRIAANGGMAGAHDATAWGMVSSRLVDGKMTWDALVSDNGAWQNHFGASQSQSFVFPDSHVLTRLEEQDRAHAKSNNLTAAVRGTYEGKTSMIANTVGFVRAHTPWSDVSGHVEETGVQTLRERFDRHSSVTADAPVWQGNYYFRMPKGFSLNLNTDFLYVYNREDKGYGMPGTSIDYNIRERMYRGGAELNLVRQHGRTQATALDVQYGITHSSDRYRSPGGDMRTMLNLQNVFLTLKHVMRGNRWYGSLQGGAAWEGSAIEGVSMNTWRPYVQAMAQYTPDRRTQMSVQANLYVNTPAGSLKNNTLLQSNNILWIEGNPRLKPYSTLNIGADYYWLASRKFYIGATASYTGRYRGELPVYTPQPDGRSVVMTYVNDGTYTSLNAGLKADLKLFNESLQLNATPRFMWFRNTGMYNAARATFYTDVTAVYYLKSFWFMAYYSPEWRNVGPDATTGFYKDYLQIQAGWSRKGFNVALSVNNPFRRNWRVSTNSMNATGYSSSEIRYGDNRHCRVGLDLSYTFSYGKKIRHDNDLKLNVSTESTVL